jgi:hypothetical protein
VQKVELMGKMQVRQEARALQGTNIQCADRTLHISGGSSQAVFESGSEGLVHLATDESTGEKFRIKCFWDPDERRKRRSEKLVEMELSNLNKSKADALGGAPFGMLSALGSYTPFAVVMKNVCGWNWRNLRERADRESRESQYPPNWWPPAAIRATWGYGLATAVMKMEERGFIHADLSPGNVVVNDGVHGTPDASNVVSGHSPEEDDAGDMALVDFDRYVHLPGDLPEPGQGSSGYASPEIWQKQIPSVGSDRTALAILIQEFLVVGDPDISRAESFDWSYDQENRCFEWNFAEESAKPGHHLDVHPLLDRKYPAVAKLLRDTLAAPTPDARATPEAWRKVLLDIVGPPANKTKPHLQGLLIQSDPIQPGGLRVAFAPSRNQLDLSTTGFGIRATLQRNSDGSIFLLVHEGATLNIKLPERKQWSEYQSGQKVKAEYGMLLSDDKGKSNARIDHPK